MGLIIIIPFGVAFLLALLVICKHKIYLWTLKNDGTESDTGAKVVTSNPKNVSTGVGQYPGPTDPELGNRGAEWESDSGLIVPSPKGVSRKSFCA